MKLLSLPPLRTWLHLGDQLYQVHCVELNVEPTYSKQTSCALGFSSLQWDWQLRTAHELAEKSRGSKTAMLCAYRKLLHHPAAPQRFSG